jgi:hypothetical protein
VLQTRRPLILPYREWEILERLAIRGPLNAGKIAAPVATGELDLRPSTINKCISRLLSDHFIRSVGSRTWRKKRVPYYTLTLAGLSILLTAGENWNRLQDIFDVNGYLLNEWNQQRLLNAWKLTYDIPGEITERVMNYYFWYLWMFMLGGRRYAPREMLGLVRLIMEKIPPDPYTLLLNAFLRSSLSETSPDLMFQVNLEKKNSRELHVKSVLARNKTVLKKVRFPDWFRSILRNANSELYSDFTAMMEWVREESRAEVTIISQELRRLRSVRS